MRVRILAALSAVLLVTALAPAPAGAITNGDPDGGAHPNVGALLFQEPDAEGWALGCTGSLLDPKVFLTAGHCAWYASYYFPEGTTFAVSFDSDLNIDAASGLVDPDTMIPVAGWEWMPSYAGGPNSPRDVGVVYLAEPVGLEPVELPPLGAAAAAVGQGAVSVGYGWNSLDRSPSSPNATYTSDGLRTVGSSWVGSVSPNWLTAHAAPSSGCYHDSGAPQFAGGFLVAMVTTGDMACVTLQRNQRLDLPDVQQWLKAVLEDH